MNDHEALSKLRARVIEALNEMRRCEVAYAKFAEDHNSEAHRGQQMGYRNAADLLDKAIYTTAGIAKEDAAR